MLLGRKIVHVCKPKTFARSGGLNFNIKMKFTFSLPTFHFMHVPVYWLIKTSYLSCHLCFENWEAGATSMIIICLYSQTTR